MGALATVEGGNTNLRAEFAARITAAWHKSREKIIALGNALIEARQKLEHGQFTAMIERDLPFTAEHARRFMRIAADPRLSNQTLTAVLPQSIDAMDELRKLDDAQFEAAIAAGAVHPNMTVQDTRAYVRQLRADAPHRPRHTDIPPPSAPSGAPATTAPDAAIAQTYSELVWLLIQRRNMRGFSQLELDQVIGWPEGMCSKLEIPHTNDGRTAGPGTLREWMTGLGVGLRVVAI